MREELGGDDKGEGGQDVSLTHFMAPLGSCTLQLNAAAHMAPSSWPELARVHPFASG